MYGSSDFSRGWMSDPSSQPHNPGSFVATSVAPTWEIKKQQLPTHEGVKCDGCNSFPLIGIRYKCSNCSNWDLCQICFEHDATVHTPTHCFLIIKSPLPLSITNSSRLTATPLIPSDIYSEQQNIFGFK